MLGISVFPGMEISIEGNLEYMKIAKEKGIEIFFTSMHIPEADKIREKSEFERILEYSKKLEIKLIVDISKNFFNQYDWSQYDIFALRLDFGFTDEEIIEISKKYPIQLNASTVDEKWFERLVKKGLDKNDFTVCHNYYPRKDTGISLELLSERNMFFKEKGIKIMAFVPGGAVKRGPLYEGLPTCEIHRDCNVLIAAQELIEMGTDLVFVGDSMATSEELNLLGSIQPGKIVLPIELLNISEQEKKILFIEHETRNDYSENVLRSGNSKKYLENPIVPLRTISRPFGTVTVDNSGYERYQGEIQISLKNLPQDDRVNILGYIPNGERLLKRIKENRKFTFKEFEKI